MLETLDGTQMAPSYSVRPGTPPPCHNAPSKLLAPRPEPSGIPGARDLWRLHVQRECKTYAKKTSSCLWTLEMPHEVEPQKSLATHCMFTSQRWEWEGPEASRRRTKTVEWVW